MITLFKANQTYTFDQLGSYLAEQLQGLPAKVSVIGQINKIFRFEFLCEPMDPLSWLNNQKADTKIYWSNRDHSCEVAGIHTADSIKEEGNINTTKLFEYFEDHLSEDNRHLRFYGGMAFDPSSLVREWQALGTCRFIVPRFEIFRSGNSTAFAVNVRIDDITEEKIKPLVEELRAIDFSFETSYIKPPPRVQSRNDFPDKKAWTKIFDQLLDAEGNIRFEKIVLARKSLLNFDRNINPVALIKHLKDMTPQCYHFCFQTGPSHAFLGASPERLYKKTGTRLESEALAGTNPRGKTEQEDLALENELLRSTKNGREHRFVVDNIKNIFQELCSRTEMDKTLKLLKLNSWQHLITQFKGVLKDKIMHEDIIAALHPTAATCGCPKVEALKTIQKLEPFNRGWYAGPVGCVGYNDSEFAVAIRSGLVESNTLSLYAGAGIVAESTADQEWDEIENKISNFLSVFALGET